MEYRLGSSVKIHEQGETGKIECPNCNQLVSFSVLTNRKTEFVPKFPLIDSKNIYFLICPKCAAIFGIDSTKGKALKRGNKLAIDASDLKDLEEFRA